MKTKRAKLHRETLRHLSAASLARVGGGTEMLTAGQSCAPTNCGSCACETAFCPCNTIEGNASGRVCTEGPGR